MNNYLEPSGSLSRTSSLPSAMNTIDRPVQLRVSSPRSHKKAQYWRNSVAITNSDYYNQWRPQISPLVVKAQGGGLPPSAPSLDTISEYEMRELSDVESQGQFKSPLVYPKTSQSRTQSRNSMADPSMFRYTPTPILDPQRQTVPTPLSRPTTPQVGSAGFAPNQTPTTPAIVRTASPSLTLPSPMANSSFLKASSQAIHVSAAANNQFLPLFLNPETGNVYMFEDGYYLPVPAKNVKELEKTTNITTLTRVPTPVS